MTLQDQRILIIGGSSGMGLAGAQLLAARGADVVIAGRTRAKLDAALGLIEGRATGHTVDFTDEASIADLIGQVGRIDHLVLAAAGEAAWGPFADVKAAAVRQAMDRKLLGYWATLQVALPHLRRDGSVVMLTGAASRFALPGSAGLAAVNGSIVAMAHTLARELAPLRVNVISPGLVDTPVYDDMPADAKAGLFSGMAEKLLVARTGVPADIAPAIAFLVENGFATDMVLDLDGGAR